MHKLIARRPRWPVMVLVVVRLGAAGIRISAIRRPILRAARWALVVNDRIEPADTIVVSLEADGAGVLEAADLIHSGMARRVAIFTGYPDPVAREFIRRGVPYEDEAARSGRQLRWLGVETIDEDPGFCTRNWTKVRCLPTGATGKGSAQSSLRVLRITRDACSIAEACNLKN